MRLKYHFFSVALSLAVLLTASTAMAGWGDAVKQAGDAGATAAGLSYTPSEAIQGIKDVLALSTGYAEAKLAAPGSFSSTPAVAIPLPDVLKGFGDSSGLLASLNRGAEGAIPSTSDLFMSTIENLKVDNYSSLLSGSTDAITRFFESSSRDTLKTLVKPVVTKSADSAGVGTYMKAFTAAQQASGSTFDIYDYLTDRTLDGMFHFMSIKEKSLRTEGGAGTTDLINKLF